MAMIKRILVPTDFSTTSDIAVGYGIDLAKRYGATLHLLHVVEDTYLAHAFPDGYYAELPGIHAKLLDEAERRLAETSNRCRAASVEATRSDRRRSTRPDDRRNRQGNGLRLDRDGNSRPQRRGAFRHGQRRRTRRPHSAVSCVYRERHHARCRSARS